MNNRDEVISLGISKSDYSKMADKASPNSPKLLNAVKAFLFGGGICLLGQLLNTLFESIGLGERQVRLATPAVLIVATAVLTGIGVFDKIARQAGAGTIVPITRFCQCCGIAGADRARGLYWVRRRKCSPLPGRCWCTV